MAWTEDDWKAQVLKDLGDTGLNALYELFFPVAATGGTWIPSFAGATGAAIARLATPATAQSAIQAINTVGAGNALLSYGKRGYIWEFTGSLAAQPVGKPEINGSGLTGDGLESPVVVAVNEVRAGARPLLQGSLESLWSKYSDNEDYEARYYLVRYDAAVELRGKLIYQINTQTGDVRREYEKQFSHIEAVINAFLADRTAALSNDSSGVTVPNGTSVKELVHKTPNGKPYGVFGRGSRGLY
jgi:hypothetical protein